MSSPEHFSVVDALALAKKLLEQAGVEVIDLSASSFPEETVLLAKVKDSAMDTALKTARRIDNALHERSFDGFVTVRAVETPTASFGPITQGVHDYRIPDLIALLTTRSRTSEAQPSLSYVPDAAANALLITAPRHHLVFGRRGAGKTALLLEGKRVAQFDGSVTCWSNLQTLRHESAGLAFLWIVSELLKAVEARNDQMSRSAALGNEISELRTTIETAHKRGRPSAAAKSVPTVRQVLSRFGTATGARVYLFLDDFHYLSRSEQPALLDLLHGATRDCDVWLKVAAIKHLTRWYDSQHRMGLETGHDADHIDLDLTLQDPSRAKRFLEEVLRRYAAEVGVRALSRILSNGALDRLVLASGAVPRDYLTLVARATQRCRESTNSKIVGVQDVNAAAGDAAQVKIEELEDDLASSKASRNSTLEGLRIVRDFCVDEEAFTYFRVGFREREERPDEYAVLTSLLDVRLLHLLEPSLSDPHHAGERYEVYMLDLSQFSGQRLKHYLRVLDLSHGNFISRQTRKAGGRSVGDTARRLITIFRAGPQLPLVRLSDAL